MSYFVNNYEGNMTDVTIVGKIPGIEEGVATFEMSLAEMISVEGKGANVYYTEDINATAESNTWRTEVEDITKVRAYKVEVQEGIMEPQSILKINYKYSVPE